jgi:hypothetical protein
VKCVGVLSRYVIQSTSRAVETESGERHRRAARDTCNECRRVQNSEPLVQKLSISTISHGSRPRGFTQRAGHATAPLKDIPDGVSVRAFCIVDYFNNLSRTSLDLWREHRSCRPSYIGLEKPL